MFTKYFNRFEEIFTQKLQSKTNWGRNEIILLLKDSIKETLLEVLDSK